MAAVEREKRNRRAEKRKADDMSPPKRNIDENSPIILSFKNHQRELDSRHDKHERLVKCSRDVTIASKRIIFLLQRFPGCENPEQILKEADEKFLEVKECLKTIASELEGEDPFLFSRAYSPGVQEYIEALSFSHYLRHKTLISFEQVKASFEFSSDGGKDLDLNPFDYILGVADLTGELMRLCINSAAKGDKNTPFEVCSFLREIYDAFTSFGNVSRDLASKIRVLKTSMQKVETACYTLKVRGSEIPQFALAEALNSEVVVDRDHN